jgi:hypothetical protein
MEIIIVVLMAIPALIINKVLVRPLLWIMAGR